MGLRTLLTVSLFALAATACGTTDDGDAARAALDGEWTAVSGVSEGSIVELVDGFAVTIGVEGSSVAGTAACNRYSGTVDIAEGSFAARDLSWTEIGCEPAVMGVEQAYLMALGRFTNYALADELLTLSSASDEWVFAPSTPEG